jgi:lipopolysaccharide export system permease protein
VRRVLDRYIFREVVTNWAVVTGVLLVILLTNQLARVLERAAENRYPQEIVLELIWLGALQNLSVIIPVGLLLGVVLAFGRLYHDSEMAAALACGAGPSRIYGPVVALALVLSGSVAWLTLELAPEATARALTLRNLAVQSGRFAAIAPGKFRTFGGDSAVVFAGGVDADGNLTQIFVERMRGPIVEVALADRARHTVSADGMTHTITLFDGERFEGMPGSPKFRIVRFAEHIVPVQVPPLDDAVESLDAAPTSVLIQASDPDALAKVHWRLAMPIMCLVLPIVAVPLSRLRPRQGRFARVWLAVLVYFVYTNLISAGEVWVARGAIPQQLGLWWVHVAVAFFGLLVMVVPPWIVRLRHRDPPTYGQAPA